MKSAFCWTGHVPGMPNERLPEQFLFGQLNMEYYPMCLECCKAKERVKKYGNGKNFTSLLLQLLCLFIFRTDTETVNSNHVSRFEVDLNAA